MIVKKYGNRRLYDTEKSKYITLDELAELVKGGADVKVVDAKSNRDLTQATLASIILESRGAAALLPVPLLKQLIRLGDDAFAEFFGVYVANALELYLQARQGTRMAMPQGNPFNPFNPAAYAQNPFGVPFGWPEPARESATAEDVRELRRELDDLRSLLKKKK
jgi:polyhydroxyalkanoate synthesis repressor PhaR